MPLEKRVWGRRRRAQCRVGEWRNGGQRVYLITLQPHDDRPYAFPSHDACGRVSARSEALYFLAVVLGSMFAVVCVGGCIRTCWHDVGHTIVHFSGAVAVSTRAIKPRANEGRRNLCRPGGRGGSDMSRADSVQRALTARVLSRPWRLCSPGACGPPHRHATGHAFGICARVYAFVRGHRHIRVGLFWCCERRCSL